MILPWPGVVDQGCSDKVCGCRGQPARSRRWYGAVWCRTCGSRVWLVAFHPVAQCRRVGYRYWSRVIFQIPGREWWGPRGCGTEPIGGGCWCRAPSRSGCRAVSVFARTSAYLLVPWPSQSNSCLSSENQSWLSLCLFEVEAADDSRKTWEISTAFFVFYADYADRCQCHFLFKWMVFAITHTAANSLACVALYCQGFYSYHFF